MRNVRRWKAGLALTSCRLTYCRTCHADAYEGWLHSAHRFSSFNNPFYLASVKETRKVVQQRDGDVRGSRWCAGCHDPVPLLSGTFDTASLEEPIEPTGQAGITCTVCHAITHINSTKGNADYTIDRVQISLRVASTST